ncbi:DUF3857 domain-containing protein [Mesonia aquimarina]|uniref:DUF3857 domain-containing protein n=1 Tax=Mesonia aquimarina TaxID=1504967 RepID=UPI000EF57F85|nr:DUF3857 domain-containing protein [Mesonia aquimarina]
MIKTTILLFSILFSFQMMAQEIEFGKVSKDELRAAKSSINPNSGAEILYINKQVHFESSPHGYNIVTEIHKRIKFYDDQSEDLENATERIYLYEGDHEKEKISKIKGYTYNLVDGKIERVKLDKSQVFEEQYTENRELASFTMPKVGKGSIIDFKYKITSPYFFNLDELKFQYDIPLKKMEADITIPVNVSFNKIPKGGVMASLKTTTDFDHRINGKTRTYSYSVSDIPALVKESYVDNIDNYRSGIVFELIAIRFNDGSVKNYSNTWGDVARTLAFHEDYEYEIKKDRIFRDELDEFLKDEQDSLQRLYKVYSFAKDHIKWNKKYGKYFDTSIRNAYKDQHGSVGDINLTLVSMLRHAGFKAVPIALSTRDYMRPVFPTVNHLNYVIAYVELNNKRYYLDATDYYSEPNIMPLRVYNYFGIFLDTPNEQWKHVDLNQPPAAKSINLVNATLNESGTIKGSIKEVDENHYAYVKRKEYFSKSKEDYLRDKEQRLGSIEINNHKVNHIDTIGEVVEEFEYQKENAFSKIGNEIIFNPILIGRYKESPFQKSKRNYPIDFIYPRKNKTVINIKIPDGYKIKEMPKSAKINFGTNIGKFEYLVSGSGQFIRISINFVMNESRISAADYESLKKYFDNIIELESKQITIEKA